MSSHRASYSAMHVIPSYSNVYVILSTGNLIPLCMSSHRAFHPRACHPNFASYPTEYFYHSARHPLVHIIPPGILSHILPSALKCFLSHCTIHLVYPTPRISIMNNTYQDLKVLHVHCDHVLHAYVCVLYST